MLKSDYQPMLINFMALKSGGGGAKADILKSGGGGGVAPLVPPPKVKHYLPV